MLRRISTLASILLVASTCFAQQPRKNEIGLLLGATVTPDVAITGQNAARIDIAPGLTFQATYARRLWTGSHTSFFFETPFLATPLQKITTLNGIVPANYSFLFVLPGVRVKFRERAGLSPWLSLGGGYGVFDVSHDRVNGTPNPGDIRSGHGAADFGGGLDINSPIRFVLPIGFRVEARDIYSGKPAYNVNTGGGFQHNLALSGGLVLRF